LYSEIYRTPVQDVESVIFTIESGESVASLAKRLESENIIRNPWLFVRFVALKELDKKILKNLFEIGLRNINIGIETIDNNIARLNKRKLTEIKHQEEIINYCNKLGIKISAFYILGYPNDTEENIKKTIKYAIKLNTNVAQFCISCPYPGTEFYKELDSNGLLLEKDFEKFNSVNLVFKHPNLTQKRILELQQYAFKKYYFRINYLINFLKWQIKEFWL